MANLFPITERQQQVLQELVAARSSPQGLVQRATIILRAFDGLRNYQIAQGLGCERHAVGLWRRRWRDSFEQLVHAECLGAPGDLRRTIERVLSDQRRAGRRPTFSPEQVALILTVACEDPKLSGRPISHWSSRELADAVIERQIVPTISARQVGRFLKAGGGATASRPVLAEQQA
jgi:putative transposase